MRTGWELATEAQPWTPRPDEWLAREPSPFAGQPGRPLFIGACPRSGTTLLRTMLNHHPELAVPAETDFVLPVWTHRGRLGDLAVEANRRRLAEWILDTPGHGGKRIRAGRFSREEAIARVVAAPGTLGSVFAALFAMFADAKGKPRWGDKRPAYATYLDALFALFPDAQVVHLVRDPRAAAESLMRVPWYAEQGGAALGAAVAGWEYSVRRVDRVAPGLRPDQLLDVRYEDLVRDPEAELQRICDFAGLGDAVEEMINRRPRGRFAPAWHENVTKPVDPALADSWRERLEPHQVALVEHAVGPYLDRFGYDRAARPGVAPRRSDLRRLAADRRRRAFRWSRYALGERKRALLHRHPVAAGRA